MTGLRQTAVFLLLGAVSVSVSAQTQSHAPKKLHRATARVPALNRAIREAIVDAALDTRPWDYYGSDCSHFVNAIFDAVGLHFDYTNSMDLYDGTDTFRRVFHPEPGDLIVWRGHVGIVIDPAEHSFYSMLSKGLRLSLYDSAYWKARGHARFLRWIGPLPRGAHTVRVARLRSEGQ